ncbi:MAG TPA: EamA family transporter, partial [Terriglobus sp.]
VLGLAGSGIAYLLYYNLLVHVSATQVVAVTYLLPLWGMLWGSVAHEPIAPIAYVGAATVVLGLVLINRRPVPKAVVQRA